MASIRQLIHEFRGRPDVAVADEANSWQVYITKGPEFVCEVTVPHDVLEWYAAVINTRDKKEVWSDWMDYSGYDKRPKDVLESEMAKHILAFVNRVSGMALVLPLKIYEEET